LEKKTKHGVCVLHDHTSTNPQRQSVGRLDASSAREARWPFDDRIEQYRAGVADPKASTLRAILEAAGVEFMDGGGVKPRRINGTQSD
jgi:hypothetical protein